MYKKILEKLKNKKIAIMGYGKEGKSTYNFIRRHDKLTPITILDKNDILKNNEYLKKDINTNIICGNTYLDNLDEYDLIIKSPGIALLDIDTKQIENKITSQLELLLEINKKNVIGITGTKGKSTTSSMIYKVIKEQNYDTFLLGNIGNPILDQIEKFKNDTILVIEMSSHQLEYVKNSPHIGIILNLYEDHLDHTKTLEKYHNDKMHIFKYQDEHDIGIYDGENKYLTNLVNKNNYKSKLYQFKTTEQSDIYLKENQIYLDNKIVYDGNQKRKLIGDHNLKNIMVVMLICKIFNLNIEKANKSINEFTPLEHRLEIVGTYNNITYINDTIATIPEATINGINGLIKVDTLIFGGMDRKINYNEFITFLEKSNISNLIGLPETGHKILDKINTNKKTFKVETIEEAVSLANTYTKPNHICLLSPAASSYNKFKNFEEKGNYYKQLIKNKYKKSDN
ncbi:MAG: UDP-N-acetylmuramoyl-L-alanine--D-glutamate ligase [Bacilli bacterium]|nr:UDP-N-acetylmuramoyl-L-alanine--D-glutamate ligase [Bacilli bacterium]